MSWIVEAAKCKRRFSSIFVNRQKQIVDTAMDQQFIDQVQRHTVNLICAVIDTVTQMGWQFPGTVGSGKTIWDSTA